ncbi:hypothetical protein EBU94_00650 [bacterium]|nr:hypothetical protein [bacterium]
MKQIVKSPFYILLVLVCIFTLYGMSNGVKSNKKPILIEKKSKGVKHFLLNFESIENKKAAKFIDRFLNTAIMEKHLYNIPIAITLSQGIVESACGESKLSRLSNNFFGMKCLSKCRNCDGKKWKRVGGCINATDDSKHDLFQVYKSPWYSWRAHSKLLTSSRYVHLTHLPATAYKKWAKGLKRAGYATEPRYAEILVNYIELYKLHEFDKVPIEQLASSRGVKLSKKSK